jgi:hypothetical protein
MRRFNAFFVLISLIFISIFTVPAYAGTKPVTRDTAIAQGEATVVAQLTGTLVTAIAASPALPADKLAAVKALYGTNTASPTAGYLVFYLGVADGAITTGGTARILAIPLNSTEDAVIAAGYTYLGIPNDTLSFSTDVSFPSFRFNCLNLFVIKSGVTTLDITGSVVLETNTQVRSLRNITILKGAIQ